MFIRSLLAAAGLLASGAPDARRDGADRGLVAAIRPARRRAGPGGNPAYHVNRYGYGNYVQGPNGAYGGYPAGSAGAIELQNEHDIKCRYSPESC